MYHFYLGHACYVEATLCHRVIFWIWRSVDPLSPHLWMECFVVVCNTTAVAVLCYVSVLISKRAQTVAVTSTVWGGYHYCLTFPAWVCMISSMCSTFPPQSKTFRFPCTQCKMHRTNFSVHCCVYETDKILFFFSQVCQRIFNIWLNVHILQKIKMLYMLALCSQALCPIVTGLEQFNIER